MVKMTAGKIISIQEAGAEKARERHLRGRVRSEFSSLLCAGWTGLGVSAYPVWDGC